MASTDPPLPVRLSLLCCAGTATARSGGFADRDEALDEGGLRLARGLHLDGPSPTMILTSPARSARQTAAAMGFDTEIEPALADMDWGEWRGRSFDEIHAAAPDDLAAWLADPAIGAPGGERYAALVERVAVWLDAAAQTGARTLALAHPMTIRAILSAAIGLSSDAAMRIDIAPLSVAEFSFHGSWRLQALKPA